MDLKVMNFLRISGLELANILVECMLFFMQTYLTDVWNLSITHAAGIVNIWNGISMVLPFLFVFIVDTYLGHFRMLVLSSITCTVGLAFITMSTPPVLANLTGTCKQYESECIGPTQKVVFYIGMALSAMGLAGQYVSAQPLLDEQDEVRVEQVQVGGERRGSKSFISVILVPVIGTIIVAKIKSWSVLFGITAICTAVATIIFLSGWSKYKKVEPKGCPLTTVCRVFVASAFKIFTPFPNDASMIYKKNQELQSFTRTRSVRFLQKAAIILPGEISPDGQVRNKWKLCSVGEVEEAKIAVRIVPTWMTFIVCGIVASIGNTYFIEQASHMNRHVGKWDVPLPLILLILLWSKHYSAHVDIQGNSSEDDPSRPWELFGKGLPLGMYFIFIAMVHAILCCITAAKIETKRLGVIRKHGLLNKPNEDIPMSVFWLYFQFTLLDGLDIFFKLGVELFFLQKSPASMRHYLGYFSKGIYGLGYTCGVLSVYVVGKVSQIGDRKNWFQHTLNNSRLDRYYWFLAALGSVNLVVSIVVSCSYRYRKKYAESI